MEVVMKNSLKLKYLGALLALFLLSACQKNELMDYQLAGKVYFNEYTTLNTVETAVTEKNYSFALQNSTLMVDTFLIQVKLMGALADADRSFIAEAVADSTTALAGTHYTLLEGVMSANSYISYLPVVLYRTEDTQEKEVSMLLQLTDAGDLGAGNSDAITFRLNWGDILLEPENWPSYYFGVYSRNKYRFAIDVLGLTNWPQTERVTSEREEGVYTISEIQRFAAILNEAYAEYKEENGPIYVDDDADVLEEIYYGTV